MTERISRLGVYSGFNPDVADGYERESFYVSVKDGCQIAIDVLHPTSGGQRVPGPLPTVLHATPYRRAFVLTGKGRTAARYLQALSEVPLGALVTQYEERPVARDLIHQGYNFVSMDLRGTGASFGPEYADSWQAGADIAQMIDWIADQPWSTDRVGMLGISYEGMVQLFTAPFAPKALTCIAPQYPGLPQCYLDGGLAISSFAHTWESLHKGMAEHEPSAPVDGPDGERLRADAEAGRNPDRYAWIESFSRLAPKDVTAAACFDPLDRQTIRDDLGLPAVSAWFTSAHDIVNASQIPTYLVTGWWDLTFAPYLIDFYNRLTTPKKLLMGPWNHGQGGDPELLRWFDHHLKGIDNGITEEPSVHFAASEPNGALVWKGTERLPLPEAQHRPFYLAEGGALASTCSADATTVRYDVDHDVTLGMLGRHSYYTDDLYINPPDLIQRGKQCLTFTTPPLSADIEITGAPALDLEVATTSDRGAIVATLEHVLADGSVAYLTEGFLNFGHRTVGQPDFGHDGPFWHSYRSADLQPVRPNEPMRLQLELYPISCILREGDCVRLTLAGADADNLIVPTIGDDATLSVTLNGDRASRLLLPIVHPDVAPTTTVIPDGFDQEEPGFAFRRASDPP